MAQTDKVQSDPQRLAQAAAAAMYANDMASNALGITLQEIAPGYARMLMKVRTDMLNGHEICHGGFIFTLADSTLAFASNSYNHIAVAARASIDFLAPARLDDLLTAVAEERALSGRSGIYDVSVQDQNNTLIALFRGCTRRIGGEIVPT